MTDYTDGICFFKGKEDIPIDSTDVEYDVRQESFFYYLFGVQEIGCYAAIDLSSHKTYLFVPKMDDLYKIWMKVLTIEEVSEKYPDFEVLFNPDIENWLKETNPSVVYINAGINVDSGLHTLLPDFSSIVKDKSFADSLNINRDTIHDILADCRSIKSANEIEFLRLAAKITSEAHIEVMKNCKPGIRESFLSSKFNAYCLEKYNCKFTHYRNI